MTVTQWECEPALAQTWPSSLVCLHSGCLLGTPQRTLCPPQPHSPSRPAAFPAPPDVQGQVEVALGLHGFAGLGQPLGPSPNRPAPHPHLDPNLWGPQPRWAPHTPHGVRPLPQPPGTPLAPHPPLVSLLPFSFALIPPGFCWTPDTRGADSCPYEWLPAGPVPLALSRATARNAPLPHAW